MYIIIIIIRVRRTSNIILGYTRNKYPLIQGVPRTDFTIISCGFFFSFSFSTPNNKRIIYVLLKRILQRVLRKNVF